MHEVLGVMNLDARVPLECGCGDIVVVADAQNRRIGVEAGENWIGDVHAGIVAEFGLTVRNAHEGRYAN